MSILAFRVQGYRSIRDVELELNQVNVITGANGVGKSNLYNALRLLAGAALGSFSRGIALEGGMPSVLWAGPSKITRRRKDPRYQDEPYRLTEAQRMTLGVQFDDMSFELVAGTTPRVPPQTQFYTDPQIKQESVWYGQKKRKSSTVLERKAGSAWIRNHEDQTVAYPAKLLETESVFSQLQEPHLYPELSIIREKLRWWRFYHNFPTDPAALLRSPQNGVRTTVLANDGSDLAAALQTIIEIGDEHGLYDAIEEAFEGAQLSVEVDKGVFSFYLSRKGIRRPFIARELSDGTLRFICLVAALLTPRPPELLALNEPESSLHDDLLLPLARLIVKASENSQIWVTTHSEALASHIETLSGQQPVSLTMEHGETQVEGQAWYYHVRE
jgi:predicted ATPase